MNRNILVVFAIILASAVMAGCRSNPVQNVEAAPVTVLKQDYQVADVRDAIIRAGSALGWAMKDVHDGHMVGTLVLRKHVAVVDITFDKASYSIKYKDSTELDYDAEKNTIHSNYNGWIQNLDRGIRAQLQLL